MKTLLTLAVSLLFFANANAQFFSALTERADKAKDRIFGKKVLENRQRR